MRAISRNSGCRICKSKRITKILKFGPQPLANAFLRKTQLKKKEPFFPLDVYFCRNCHLVQLRDIVSPEILFKDYVYVSSTSPVFMKHFQDFARTVKRRFRLTKNSLVIDIGSNDGILLAPCQKLGMRVLGIEPARNIAKLARKNNIDTVDEYFSLPLVKKIRKNYGLADIITANNVFAHINDIDEVARGVKNLLTNDGVFIIEVPYLVDFLDKNLFDTVYHEHLSYFSLQPLLLFFRKQGMRVFDVERIPTHGGSLRAFVCKEDASHKSSAEVKRLIHLEQKRELHIISTYRQFASRIEINKRALIKLLTKIKKSRKKIAGYGAPAKGNTLLNYFGITTKHLDYIVEDSVYKQGLFSPGTHIEIDSPDRLRTDPPDYILILAWNFADSIKKKLVDLTMLGGKFIVPVPKPILC